MTSTVLVVGANSDGECGINDNAKLLQLTNFSIKNKQIIASDIANIYNGKGYTIYEDTNGSFYASGNNKHYSCCIHITDETIKSPQIIDYFSNKSESVTTKEIAPSHKLKGRRNVKKRQKKKDKKANKLAVEHKVSTKKDSSSSIAIKKLCVNVSGYCTFFISENNKVYGNGNNRNFQLGHDNRSDSWHSKGFRYICEPKEINKVCNNLIDIKSSSSYSIALRMSDHRVMMLYCNRNKYDKGLQLHDDVFILIVAYVGELSTTDCGVYQTSRGGQWTPIKAFEHKDIIKVF